MYHLWAHVATFMKREWTDNVQDLTDDKFLRTCDNCQTIFESVYDKVKHYMEVHRGIFVAKFCHVCEFAEKPNQPHKTVHKNNEMPFECRKCRLRFVLFFD